MQFNFRRAHGMDVCHLKLSGEQFQTHLLVAAYHGYDYLLIAREND